MTHTPSVATHAEEPENTDGTTGGGSGETKSHEQLFGVDEEEEEEEDPRARGHQAGSSSGVAAGHMGLKSTVVAGALTGGLRSVEDGDDHAPRSPRAGDDDENDTNTEGDD
jgi:hypothetical protein